MEMPDFRYSVRLPYGVTSAHPDFSQILKAARFDFWCRLGEELQEETKYCFEASHTVVPLDEMNAGFEVHALVFTARFTPVNIETQTIHLLELAPPPYPMEPPLPFRGRAKRVMRYTGEALKYFGREAKYLFTGKG